MHTLNKIKQQIVELSAFKSACCHYLASHHAAIHVENASIVTLNKDVANHNLKQLYMQLYQLKPHNPCQNSNFKVLDYQYSILEKNAILHFNNDDRFTITE